MSTTTVAPDDDVHLGGKHWHRDQGGIPACPQVLWQLGGETDVVSRAEAERVGYDRCTRCAGGGA